MKMLAWMAMVAALPLAACGEKIYTGTSPGTFVVAADERQGIVFARFAYNNPEDNARLLAGAAWWCGKYGKAAELHTWYEGGGRHFYCIPPGSENRPDSRPPPAGS
jgi:hypothetical protein